MHENEAIVKIGGFFKFQHGASAYSTGFLEISKEYGAVCMNTTDIKAVKEAEKQRGFETNELE